MTEDSSCRVRASIIDHMPMLAQHFGPNFFKEKLIGVYLNLLKDNVFFVRKAAIQNIHNLVLKMRFSWSSAEILPYIQQIQLDSNYSNRLTALKCYQLLLLNVDLVTLSNVLLTSVISIIDDSVPNIRFTAVKTLQQYVSSHGKDAISEIKKSISKLLNDPDRDVRHFASTAMMEV